MFYCFNEKKALLFALQLRWAAAEAHLAWLNRKAKPALKTWWSVLAKYTQLQIPIPRLLRCLMPQITTVPLLTRNIKVRAVAIPIMENSLAAFHWNPCSSPKNHPIFRSMPEDSQPVQCLPLIPAAKGGRLQRRLGWNPRHHISPCIQVNGSNVKKVWFKNLLGNGRGSQSWGNKQNSNRSISVETTIFMLVGYEIISIFVLLRYFLWWQASPLLIAQL